MTTFGSIGTGNMGGALAQALCTSIDPKTLYLTDHISALSEALAEKLGANATTSSDIAQNCDYILLGVKPQYMAGMLNEISPILAARTTPFVLVSMAGGVTLAQLETMTGGHGYPIIRIMPNTPCSIGKGAIMYHPNSAITPEQLDGFLNAFQGAGMLTPIAENLINAGTAVSGCGPAYVDLFIEALADGGVSCGLSRKQAMDLACATLIGSAQLIIDSGRHPGDLKDAVCSPAGSTIQGVRALEAGGFRSTVIEAVIAACNMMEGK
ncbi:pyrroline-5-carboxylate reductase [Bengtsoniella intestinalis]|uniref:pyrroline-5-carboxylate reductase n=1 Tax=Bengtsoniella intestinalis TaxID=3073143 RepID=UPI00391F842A